jgi:hypothetical protein
MRRILIFLVLTLFAGNVFAQSTTQPPATTGQTKPASPAPGQTLKDSLGWMLGEWEGEGVSRGEREFIGKMSVNPELDDEALLLRRESMNKEGGPTGGLKEMMLIGVDGTTKKIILTLYTNKNYISLYVGEVKGDDVVFNSTTAGAGFTDRRTFRRLPDGSLSFFTEGGGPGKPVAKLVEINFKKKT